MDTLAADLLEVVRALVVEEIERSKEGALS